MPIDPQAHALLHALDQQAAVDFTTIDAPTFRASFAAPAPTSPPEPVGRTEEILIEGSQHHLRLRLYAPAGKGPWPVTLYFYGSGFAVGSIEQVDPICRALAARAQTLVLSVDYRLAPESPFPAAVEDALAALHWLREHVARYGGDASRIAVAGDSAGGNLAAVLAQLARDEGIPLRHQLMMYPPLDASSDSASYRRLATGYGFTAAWMDWFWRQYLSDPAHAADLRVSPLRQPKLEGLASATIFTAEYDILRDDAEAYATALRAAGVEVRLKRWPGQLHGFVLMQGQIDAADAALNEAAAALRQAFA